MEIKIRQEQENDYKVVCELIELAFRNMEESDHREHLLVECLRKSEAFIPELSLVAEKNGEIIGHILMTKVEIVSDVKTTTSLALAPVAVLPKYQRQGVGGTLICEIHKRAAELGYGSAVLLGHKDYYPNSGKFLFVPYTKGFGRITHFLGNDLATVLYTAFFLDLLFK